MKICENGVIRDMSPEEIAEIEKDFQRTLEKCQEVTLENRKKGTFFLRLEGWLLKWLAPLM